MKPRPIPVLAAACLLFAALPAIAQMNYQGRLTDDSGTPLAVSQVTLTFSLWDAAELGNRVWGDQQIVADLIDGRFNVVLGPLDQQDPPRDLADAFGTERFLQIRVGSDPALPRQQVLAAPAALHARRADHAATADHATTADTVGGFGGGEEIHYVNPAGMMAPFAGPSTKVPQGWLVCDGSALSSAAYPGLYAAIGHAWGDGSNDTDPETDFNVPDLRGMFLRGGNGARDDNFKDPEQVTQAITAAVVTGPSVADLTFPVAEPFPATVRLHVSGLAASPAAIPDGGYDATRVDATTWRITGGTGFIAGNHAGLSGSATGSSRTIGSYQAGSMPTHTHQWGYYSSTDLWTWNLAGNPVMALERLASNQIPGGSGKDDDYMEVRNASGGYWTEPVPPAVSSGTENRPNNAAVTYIIKY